MMNDQTDSATLLRLAGEMPAIRLCVDVLNGGAELTLPAGNQVATALFAALLRSALEFDQVEVLGSMYGGEFNHGFYWIFVERAQAGMAALILKSVVEKYLPFALHCLEIVEVDDSATVVSMAGDQWGTSAERRARALAWMLKSGDMLTAEAAKVHAQHETNEAGFKALLRRLDQLEREMRERLDEGEEWKKGGDQE